MTFQHYNAQTAPEASKPHLSKIESETGFIPEIVKVLAGAPAALEGYVTLDDAVQKTAFTPEERDIILTVFSYAKVKDVQKDKKLEALRQYALGLAQNKGRPADAVIHAFLAAGYTPPQALDIVLIAAFCTLKDCVGSLAHISAEHLQ